MLQQIFIAVGDDVERKYIAASDVASFFEPMGVDDRHDMGNREDDELRPLKDKCRP
jgi:hypothetical protein